MIIDFHHHTEHVTIEKKSKICKKNLELQYTINRERIKKVSHQNIFFYAFFNCDALKRIQNEGEEGIQKEKKKATHQ
jgi:hypothetical protein